VKAEIVMQMKAFLIATILPLSAAGCTHWQASNAGSHWESGNRSSTADWKAHGNRHLQKRITVLESVQTSKPTVDANYEMTAFNAISHMLATARPAQGNHVEDTQGAIDDNGMVAEDAFDSTRPVLYSTTVNLNDYDQTTNFGRLMSEALATALTQHWENKVINMNLRQGSVPILPRQGEFFLSRDVNELALDYNAGAVMVSTYTVAIDKVYVNVELVNVHHNAVVAAVMFDIPLGPRTEALLRGIEFADSKSSFLRGGM
jgi:TolB-like protein|tara:strand:+ start:2449 stop:3228 length:780 start_codon:yes stop_codon:yes gene_type:complete